MTVAKKEMMTSKEKTKKPKKTKWSQNFKSVDQKEDLILKKDELELAKSLYYVGLLRSQSNLMYQKSPLLLKAFLSESGKIKPRQKTRIKLCQQRRISKAIRQARALSILPFTCSVKV